MDYIEKIRQLVEKASSLHILNYNNQSKHDKAFNPPATKQQITDFEQEIGMTLPIAFVRYLTELGNGGIGADYGIWSLDEIRQHNNSVAMQNTLSPMLDHSMTDTQWTEFAEKYASIDEKINETSNDECEQLTEQHLEMQRKMTAGGIFISTSGCTMLSILMCRGNARGEVFVLDFDYMEQIYSEPHCCGKFEDWIINDLQERINKKIPIHRTE